MDFKAKTIMIDEIMLPMRKIDHLHDASTLRLLKLNSSLAKELISTKDTNKCAIQRLDTKYSNVDRQSIVSDNCYI